ncbi:conserved exported protein of unknown function [Tenacibaculum sp. 190524A02b]|uniref:hypothetical protein n=1 Tax=Tenacibaculum vairaonense TaxID=3137860 RepID=UPI0032B108AC
MKALTIICLLTLIISAPTFAQVENMNFNPQMIGGTYQNNTINSNSLNGYENIKGSIYLFKNWYNKSTITSETNKKFTIANLNYNLNDGTFIAKLSKDSVYVFQNIKSVKMNNFLFVKLESGFYEQLVNGKKLNLYKKHSGKLKKPIFNKMTNQQIKAAEFVKTEEYFYLYKNDQLKELKLKKASILKLMSTHKNTIKKYTKENRLSFKKESDIVKIFKQYNKLK